MEARQPHKLEVRGSNPLSATNIKEVKMIRTIINILRKYLKEAYREEEQWEAIVHDPFDLIAAFPDYNMLRRLAHDLVKVTKTEKCEKHIRIPDQKATVEFIKSIMPTGGSLDDSYIDEFFLDYHARHLRRWLLNWNTTVRTYRERRPINPLLL